MKKSGQNMLTVDWNLKPEQVTPSDVYDVATLLVSELRALEAQIPGTPGQIASTPRSPGRKLPSENVQLSGLLDKQLRRLQKLVESNPERVKGPERPN